MTTVGALRRTGSDIVHLREQALHKLPDDQILRKAELEDRVVLMFDLDFGDLLAAGATTRPSVILFRLRDQTLGNVAPKLMQIIGECSGDLATGAIVIVEDERYRIRRLPIRRGP